MGKKSIKVLKYMYLPCRLLFKKKQTTFNMYLSGIVYQIKRNEELNSM